MGIKYIWIGPGRESDLVEPAGYHFRNPDRLHPSQVHACRTYLRLDKHGAIGPGNRLREKNTG
jgi:hypothetical protein